MKFIDETIIRVRAGNGGKGSVHFRREKFVPLGGPDGGDGGHGGSVILVGDRNKRTLFDLHLQPHFHAQHGSAGQGSLKTGSSGEDLRILVPLGTEIHRKGDLLKEGEPLTEVQNLDEKTFLYDISEHGQEVCIAHGGRGGKGNAFFKSPTRQAPDFAQPGEQGEAGLFFLSLKLIADVGLIGLPNAGKSTFISRVSSAKPKIADYPFTTLVPNLGVVAPFKGESFVVADIPGLIPGAHEGKGLGISFLKHVERTKVLLHLIDVAPYTEKGEPLTPREAYNLINHELEQFSEFLPQRPTFIVLTKIDALENRSELQEIVKEFNNLPHPVLPISSATGEGITELLNSVVRVLKEN